MRRQTIIVEEHDPMYALIDDTRGIALAVQGGILLDGVHLEYHLPYPIHGREDYYEIAQRPVEECQLIPGECYTQCNFYGSRTKLAIAYKAASHRPDELYQLLEEHMESLPIRPYIGDGI